MNSRHSPLASAAAPLLSWYDTSARTLPWRADPTPYHVWISEIMLQQTRVEAVRGYYERFLAVFPDIASLAAAPEEKLLKVWEGLGYYSRARNLKKCAQQLMDTHGAALPADYDALLALPGIGPYTAGAIASIAFGLPRAAVDGNVLRVVSRIEADASCIDEPRVRADFAVRIEAAMPPGRSGDFNQALMELGATVCLPVGAPKCACCPARRFCLAHAAGETARYPVRREKRARRIEERTLLVIIQNGRGVLRRRAPRGLLAGMAEFVSSEGNLNADEAETFSRALGFLPAAVAPLGRAKHIFTHVEWHMTGYLVHALGDTPPEGFFAVSAAELTREYALPSAFSFYKAALLVALEGRA